MVQMRVLYFLVEMFINTFGITRPSEKGRKQAAFFILALMLLTLAAAAAAGFLAHSVTR